MSKEYLVAFGCYDMIYETERQIEKAESKGCSRRKFFKIDSEGFLYVTNDRPESITTRDDYED